MERDAGRGNRSSRCVRHAAAVPADVLTANGSSKRRPQRRGQRRATGTACRSCSQEGQPRLNRAICWPSSRTRISRQAWRGPKPKRGAPVGDRRGAGRADRCRQRLDACPSVVQARSRDPSRARCGTGPPRHRFGAHRGGRAAIDRRPGRAAGGARRARQDAHSRPLRRHGAAQERRDRRDGGAGISSAAAAAAVRSSRSRASIRSTSRWTSTRRNHALCAWGSRRASRSMRHRTRRSRRGATDRADIRPPEATVLSSRPEILRPEPRLPAGHGRQGDVPWPSATRARRAASPSYPLRAGGVAARW